MSILSPEELILKYYPRKTKRHPYYVTHVKAVAKLAQKVLSNNPQLIADAALVQQMALLHDIGIVFTNAPEIGCEGKHPYIMHGFLGRELLEREGYGFLAPICERHVGVGLSLEEIKQKELPLPHRDMLPISIEELVVCYADKFFSKSADDLRKPKSLEKIRKGFAKHGPTKLARFELMVAKFGTEYIYKTK
jgi:uncharacterized protein